MAVVLLDDSSAVGSGRWAQLGRSLANPMVGDNSGPLVPLVLEKLGSEREGSHGHPGPPHYVLAFCGSE